MGEIRVEIELESVVESVVESVMEHSHKARQPNIYTHVQIFKSLNCGSYIPEPPFKLSPKYAALTNLE